MSIDKEKHNDKEILDTLQRELKKADASGDWKIVFAHYPAFSGGHYDGWKSTRDRVLPILKEHNVDLYITGHDHNMQHWSPQSGKGIGMVMITPFEIHSVFLIRITL